MPTNTISGSGASSPVNLYKTNQAGSQSSPPVRQETEAAQRPSQTNETFSVQISQEALELQKRGREQEAAVEQDLQADREVRKQADKDIQAQREESKEYTEQQSIDVVV